MGWYYTYGATKADIIREVTADSATSRTIKHAVRGNELYFVREVTNADGTTDRYIAVYLLGTGGKPSEGWGYKPMDEDMMPYYFKCPLSFFELAPNVRTENARQWREKVRAAAARKSTLGKVKPGDTIVLVAGVKVDGRPLTEEVVSGMRGRTILIRGNSVRVPPRMIAEVRPA